MKRTKWCPKCFGMDILRVEGQTGYDTGNNSPTDTTASSTVDVPRYVCCNCGYVEEWVDPVDIRILKKQLNKAF